MSVTSSNSSGKRNITEAAGVNSFNVAFKLMGSYLPMLLPKIEKLINQSRWKIEALLLVSLQ